MITTNPNFEGRRIKKSLLNFYFDFEVVNMFHSDPFPDLSLAPDADAAVSAASGQLRERLFIWENTKFPIDGSI